MNDSTPLLGQVIGHIPPTDSDLFIKCVESPWIFISNRSLFFIRSFLALVMTLVLSVYLTLEILAGRGKITVFRLMNLTWAGQCAYLWLTSYWMYLYAISEDHCRLPYAYTCRRYRSYSADVSLFTIRGVIKGCLSCITNFPSGQSSWNLFLFHTFYTVITVLPITSALLYFLLLYPSDHPAIVLELILNTFNSMVALMELFILNSIAVSTSARDQKRMLVQALILALLTIVYCTYWTSIGNRTIHNPGEKLDWRFFGEGWNEFCPSFTLVAVNVVCGLYTVWWMLELVKGWVLEWRKQKLLNEPECFLTSHVNPISSGPGGAL